MNAKWSLLFHKWDTFDNDAFYKDVALTPEVICSSFTAIHLPRRIRGIFRVQKYGQIQEDGPVLEKMGFLQRLWKRHLK
jgi:hypothetical protein